MLKSRCSTNARSERIENRHCSNEARSRRSGAIDGRPPWAYSESKVPFKQRYLKQSPTLHKVSFDAQLDTVQHALGVNMAISKVHGSRLKAQKEIRIASTFKQAPEAFLQTIVVHELAHLRERNHDKAFYRLCQHMLPDYHQREFDLRVWLMAQELNQA